MGMKWYHFLIRFALFYMALTNFSQGLAYLTGVIYESESGGKVSAEMIYETWGIGLKIADVLFGLLLVFMAVFAIIVRNKLAKFKMDAPRYLNLYYIIFPSLQVAYGLAILWITDTNASAAMGINSCVYAAVLIYINTKYFEKRQNLFGAT